MVENNYNVVDFEDKYERVEAAAFERSMAFNEAVIGIKFTNVNIIESRAFHHC
jgi:hypothetical protein